MMYKAVLKNNQGSIMLLMTFLVLASILMISLSLSAIVVNGLKMGTTQVHSTKAFFAAEAGAERILWEIRGENDINPGEGEFGHFCGAVHPAYFCFSNNTDGTLDQCAVDCSAVGKFENQQLANNSTYKINFDYGVVAASTTRLKSYGNYNNEINRIIELRYLD